MKSWFFAICCFLLALQASAASAAVDSAAAGIADEAYAIALSLQDLATPVGTAEWREAEVPFLEGPPRTQRDYLLWQAFGYLRGENKGLFDKTIDRLNGLPRELIDAQHRRLIDQLQRLGTIWLSNDPSTGLAQCDEYLNLPGLTASDRVWLLGMRGAFHFRRENVSAALADATAATGLIGQSAVLTVAQMHLEALKNLLYLTISDQQGFLESVRREILLTRATGYPTDANVWFYNIGGVLEELGDIDRAQEVVEMFRTSVRNGSAEQEFFADLACAGLAGRVGNTDRELSCLLSAELHLDAVFNRAQSTLTRIGNIYAQRNDPEQAQIYLAKAQAHREPGDDADSHLALDHLAAKVAHLQGDSSAAFEQLSDLYDRQGDRLRAETERVVAELRSLASAEAQSLIERNDLLDEKAALQSVVIERQYQMTWLGALVLAVCLLFAVFQWRSRRKLKLANEQVLAASSAKSLFLANMSHEIRTPMNGVLGMAQLIQDTSLTVEQQSYVDTIYQSGDALLAIINDVLDYSKIESGRLEIVAEPVSLRQLAEDVAALLRPNSANKGIELVVACDPELPDQLEADGGRLRQVLLNLLSNAVKFTHEGHVLLALRCNRSEQGAVVQCSVADTGIGIEPHKRDLIFEQFSQAESTTTRTYGGTGLGLAISRALIEAMGGTLTVESEPGVGSVFEFELVLKVSDGAPAVARDIGTEGAQPVDAAAAASAQVLLLDDLEPARIAMAKTLTTAGFRVTLAADLTAAIELAQSGMQFDLWLIDLDAVSDKSRDDQQRLRALASETAARIVGLSARSKLEAEAAQQVFGAEALLLKPVSQVLLLDALQRTLDPPSARLTDPEPRATHAGGNEPRGRDQAASPRVLLVDDNAVNRLIAEKMLASLNCQVCCAVDGPDAIAQFRGSAFDLVFMDISMPEMDGMAATSVIRDWERDQNRPVTPVVALTAHAMSGDEERFLAAGMNEYLSKPVRREALADALERLLSVG